MGKESFDINLLKCSTDNNLLNEIDWPSLTQLISSKYFLKELHPINYLAIAGSWEDSKKLYQELQTSRSMSHQIATLLVELSSFNHAVIKGLASTSYNEIPDLDEIAQFCHFFNTAIKSDVIHHGLYQRIQDLELDSIKNLLQFFLPTTEKGKFLFHKIPGLEPVRKQLEVIYFQLNNELENAIQRELESILQNKNFVFRDSKYCVAISAERYEKKHGKIVSQSNTGRTFYVEPYRLEKLNAQYQSILEEFDNTISVFKYSTLELLKRSQEDCLYFILFLSKIDSLNAKDNFTKSATTIPRFDNSKLLVKLAKHPLIVDAVPNTIDPSTPNTLISGANSSGKTVYLKTICLCFLMARCGIPLTASEAIIPEVDYLIYPTASHQQILQGTSSFIAEFDTLEKAFQADGSKIIIWDEAFGNTSSQNASALILSIVEQFSVSKNVIFFISTHHDQLKTLAKNINSFSLLSTDPDFKYGLIKNLTSLSNPTDAIKRIRPNSQLLPAIESKYLSYSNLNKDFLENFYKELLEKEKTNRELLKAMEVEIKVLRDEISNSQMSLSEKQKYHSKLNKIETIQPLNTESVNLDSNTPSLLENIELNSFYTSRSLGIQVKVIASHKKGFECLAKGKRIVLPTDDLISKHSSQKNSVKIEFISEGDQSFRHDLRGMRRDDFYNEAEKIIGSIVTGRIGYAEIIHGKGNGVLIEAIRQLQKEYSDLEFKFADDLGSVTIKS